MKYDFSAHWLKIETPDTSFDQAWESLCYALLKHEHGNRELMRLKPPDKGIDIWDRTESAAYQCKSTIQGALGSIGGTESAKSLEKAFESKESYNWTKYIFATNAEYTGEAFSKVLTKATQLGVEQANVLHRGPSYWDELCEKHWKYMQHFFKYRVDVPKPRVLQAFEDARYYPKYIERYGKQIMDSNLTVVLTNNRTPLELRLPFSPDLTIENLLDIGMTMLGLSLDSSTYADIGMEASPAFSVVFKGNTQDFGKTLEEAGVQQGDKIELWIKIVYSEIETEDDGKKMLEQVGFRYMQIPRKDSYIDHKEAVRRLESTLQGKIWENARMLLESPGFL